MIYEIFFSKALHMNSKICIEISVEVQETAQLDLAAAGRAVF